MTQNSLTQIQIEVNLTQKIIKKKVDLNTKNGSAQHFMAPCKYFLYLGNCKFGANCKFTHIRYPMNFMQNPLLTQAFYYNMQKNQILLKQQQQYQEQIYQEQLYQQKLLEQQINEEIVEVKIEETEVKEEVKEEVKIVEVKKEQNILMEEKDILASSEAESEKEVKKEKKN